MKITGPGSVGGPQAGKGVRPASGGGFSLGSAGRAAPAGQAAPTTGVGPVASLDAILALQEAGGPLERRRKAVRRATSILDVLDEVKISLLDGAIPAHALEKLTRAIRQERADVGDDPRLNGLLNEIETRAAVELAKLKFAERGSTAA